MALKRLFAQQERQSEPTPPLAVVEDLTPSSVDRPEASEQTPPEPLPIEASEREPGEDEVGIDGVWPGTRKRSTKWSLSDWVRGARGDFHVFEGLFGVKPISRGFSWKD